MEINLNDLEFEVGHIGINQQDKDTAKNTSDILTDLFGFSQRETSASTFVSEDIEVMHSLFLGKLGHIGIKTKNVTLAKEYLASKGIEFNMETAKYDPDGNLIVIYLKNDIAGFAFHIMQKK